MAAGKDGRVLVNCFRRCPLNQILRAMHLRLRDLFSSEPPSPEQRRLIEVQREQQRKTGRELSEAAADARSRPMSIS
jgi:hypothetical protein